MDTRREVVGREVASTRTDAPRPAPAHPALTDGAFLLRLRIAVYLTALTVMLGVLLWLGKALLLPILAAVIALYILSAAATALGRVPLCSRLPNWARRTLALLAFTAGVVLLFVFVGSTIARVVAALPVYEDNLRALVARLADLAGLEGEPTWERLRALTLDRLSVSALAAPLAGSIGGFGGTLFLIVLYASFLLAEQRGFLDKLDLATDSGEQRERTITLLSRVNERIGQYLLVKTVVNAILGAISYAIMWLLGIEFALFWAILIAFLNYVPYVGSLIGVVFPVFLGLAQSGSLLLAGVALVTLTAAQVFVGSVLEPRMMGRAFNLSPFVVLIALAFWGSLWGVAGAILSVPLTSILVIVLAEVRATRPAAIMLSASGRV